MDEIDRRIVSRLRADSRESIAGLAAHLKVSRGTVQNRIDRMVAQGDITGFTIATRPDVEDQRIRAIMSIAIEGERSAAVVRALRGFRQVEAIHSTNGRWDLIAELACDSLAEFARTLDEARLIEGIAQTETNILLATQRF
ncbi:MAG: Lrp/AsnC family transcriptional regulator [Phenylobacterium sp.]